MKCNKVSQKILLWNTILYRISVTVETALFMWLFGVFLETHYNIKMSSLQGGFAIGTAWNVINMLTYWVWHFYLFKWFGHRIIIKGSD